jgi:hypothetical protein
MRNACAQTKQMFCVSKGWAGAEGPLLWRTHFLLASSASHARQKKGGSKSVKGSLSMARGTCLSVFLCVWQDVIARLLGVERGGLLFWGLRRPPPCARLSKLGPPPELKNKTGSKQQKQNTV